MQLGGFLAAMIPLGLGGFDIAPALIAAVFLANRAVGSRRHVLIFGATLLGGTVLWGLLLATALHPMLKQINWHQLLQTVLHAGWCTVALKLVLILTCIGYGIYALNRSTPEDGTRTSRGLTSLLLIAAGFIAIVTTDPPFLAAIVLSADQPLWAVALALCLWTLISQLPLAVLCGAILMRQDARFTRWLTAVWQKTGPLFRRWLAISAICVGLVLALDLTTSALWGRDVWDLPIYP
ncbi:hypothetical protein [Rothia sp. (in: high G+C Gram-positive bacteria)]|uniref:hypothetical protein n=1 Tax=Rothia sp. (in: high G+C Gram-positive bacteria) TaxID=1885016 RepID=UPI000EC427C9|nr:hypothetical protein [Rothia sp. (in: high G+C Gram-positive bacteria)]